MIGVALAVTLYLNRIVDNGFELGLGIREIAADPAFVTGAVPSVLAYRTLVSAAVVLLVALAGFLLPYPDGIVLGLYALTLLAVGIGTRWVHLGLHRTGLAAVAAAAGQLAMMALVIGLVRNAGDLFDVARAQVIGDLVAALILGLAFARLHGNLAVRLDWAQLRPLLPRAWFLVAGALLGILIYNADFLFLRFFDGSAAVGYYAAAYTLVSFFFNIGATYNLSLLPALTRARSELEGRDRLYRSAVSQVFAVGLPLALGGSFLAGPIIGLIYGAEYRASALPLALLVWCIPLNLLRDVPLVALMSEGRERATFRITAKAAVLNLVLNSVLIPTWGLVGAAIATLATETLRMVLAFRESGAVGFPMPRLGLFGKAAVAGAAMALALGFLAPDSIWVGIPLGVLVYAIALTLVGGLKFAGGLRLEA